MTALAALLDLVAPLGPFLLPLALKAALVLLVAGAAARLARGASAAWRHAVWAGALAALLAVTLLPLALPAWEVPVPLLPEAPPAEVAAATARAVPAEAVPLRPGAPGATVAGGGGATTPEAAPARAFLTERPLAALALVWVLGVLAVGGWWLVSALAAWRLAARAAPVKDGRWLALLADVADDLGLRSPVRLLRSQRLGVPVTWGALGPVLILPAEADAWDAARSRAVLAHELAHVRRRDVLWQWVAQLACALHWYQPLAWLAYRRLLAEREHACDDAVLRAGTRPSAYADVLLGVARAVRRREPIAALAMAPMARRSQLEGRLLSILDPSLDRRGLSRVLLTVLGAVTLLVAASLAGVQPVPARADASPFDVAAVSDTVNGPDEGAALTDRERTPALGVGAMRLTASADDFQWNGSLAPGEQLLVKNLNGEIVARGGDDDRVVIEAEQKDGRRGEPAEIEVVEFDGGVVACVRYPGQTGACSPTSAPKGDVDNGRGVSFTVRVPRGVHFEGTSVNGAVRARGLSGDVVATSVNGAIEATTSGGDVEASSVNGAVRASASGTVRASTVNGAIVADMGRADWSGTAEYSTVNGAIELTLPSDFSADVEATTMSGNIRSDFPLDIRRGRSIGVSASGTVGSGGRRMKLSTQNGSIELRRSSRGARLAPAPARSAAGLRAAVADTLRAAHRLAQVTHSSGQAVDLRVDERGLRLVVDGQVEMDLGWDALAREAEGAVEDALDQIDWDAIADEVEAAMQDANVSVQVQLGALRPTCPPPPSVLSATTAA